MQRTGGVGRRDGPRTALVLSGGGARGAYEAGVLAYLYGELVERLGRPLHFDIVTGTSVGAIHACYAGAFQHDADAWKRLPDVWESLSLERVFGVGPTDLLRVPWRMLGLGSSPPRLPAKGEIPERLPGLFDTGWLESIVLDTIDWKRLHAELDEGSLHAVAVAATEIGTGRSVVFVDSPHGPVRKWSRDHFVVTRTTRLAPAHALASAAIPMAFPAVQIDGAFYSDGGLRLNTPLSPALRLGADRVLVIGLRHVRPQAELDRLAQHREVAYSNPVYLAGKALDALLLDRVEHDLDRLRLFNAILRTGRAAYGQEFLGRINEAVVPERGAPYRVVEDFLIRPSRDLGELAAECLAIQRPVSGLSDWLSRNVVRYAGRGAFGEADLLSYLFFDRCYTEHLIALGRHDAASAADDLLEFLS